MSQEAREGPTKHQQEAKTEHLRSENDYETLKDFTQSGKSVQGRPIKTCRPVVKTQVTTYFLLSSGRSLHPRPPRRSSWRHFFVKAWYQHLQTVGLTKKKRWFWSLISSFDFLLIKAKTEQDRLKPEKGMSGLRNQLLWLQSWKSANWHFLDRFLDRMVNTTHWMFQSDGSPEGCVRDTPQEINGRKFQTLPPQDQSTRVSPADLNASKLCNLVLGFHYEAQNCQVIETDMRSKQKTRTSTRRSGLG